ncbi:bis(5'-nucleosyl)-tetraphosphatase (symmetrical) YqeK [Wansuia hejianensis]|uniref:bis(5'-nucleosyl)-tetraphosphatase (symmetrical) n=1 Tax=Wansuia hejianensis TaxID=2763667 RepID=A0A926F2M8_9FIRM|nr:bis(5'-nucleosyl)-tetraphosphatase (symmetrical) YqeK [Wansuia hejianensis]MBC8590809.1 bis(5'-nucleosyl)-tetraphosphatase (symmetrical) YqeK [Wansuia hejianensis]
MGNVEELLLRDIGQKRLDHSLRVADIAKELGSIYGANLEKINIAALLHDCGKYLDKYNLLKIANEFGIILDEIMMKNLELIHAPLGSKIAKTKYGVTDVDVLNAIKYHTTGRENMSLLEKIIFISDYIEPGRSFPGVEEVRKLAYIDINKSVLTAMDNTLKFLIDTNKLISIETVKARNFMKIQEMKGAWELQ